MNYERKIAKIVDTFLGVEDHGHLVALLTVDYGGARQGVGGYSLDEFDPIRGRRVGTVEGLDLIAAILRACGVDSWERLRGRTIHVLTEPGSRQPVGIENLPTEPGERLIFADVFTSEEES